MNLQNLYNKALDKLLDKEELFRKVHEAFRQED